MSNTHSTSNPCRALLITFVSISFMTSLTACDRYPTPNTVDKLNEATTTEAEPSKPVKVDKNIPDTPNTTPNSDATPSVDKVVEEANTNDTSVVSLNGYQGLHFNQMITPEVLKSNGLVREDKYSDECYYVSNPKQNVMNDEGYPVSKVAFQVINGRMKLIDIYKPDIPFYTGIKVGDSVNTVMRKHDNNLDYELGKYAIEGDTYQLINNANFSLIKPIEAGVVIKQDDIKLDTEATVPLQVKYVMTEGRDMGTYSITSDDWDADTIAKLAGKVKEIKIGTPDAIMLVEGCS